MLPFPVIFVPGITASYLKDHYPLPPQTVWSVLRKRFERVSQHPDNPRYEADQPARVVADQIFEIAYEELIEELRSELKDEARAEVPVYPFAYDWRLPLDDNVVNLREFVQEVCERTALMKHYHKKYGNEIKVNLVGHSMGGLLISRLVTDSDEQLPIGKVATLGTPYKGSLEAVVKLTMGVGTLGASKPSHSERRAARLTPALYQLLPAFSEGIEIEDPLPKSLFDASTWQPSVTESIAEYIREKSVIAGNKAQREERANTLFSGFLHGGEKSFSRIANLDLASQGLTDDDWLVVVGAGVKTRVGLNVECNGRKPQFRFDSKSDLDDRWDAKATDDSFWRSGDGTVPLRGAMPPFISEDRIVVITPNDYGPWEISDKLLTSVGGFHGVLPNMNLVHRMLVAFFTDASNRYGNLSARGVPSAQRWNPPLRIDPAE